MNDKKSGPIGANPIMIVGDEPTILSSRAVQLAQWTPLTTTSEGAITLLKQGGFQLVVIGQSVPENRAATLIEVMYKMQPPPKLLLIRNPESHASFGVPTFVQRPDMHPGWLLERVREMLAAPPAVAHFAGAL